MGKSTSDMQPGLQSWCTDRSSSGRSGSYCTAGSVHG